MFSQLRDPGGGFSGLMVGLALLAIAGFALFLPLPPGILLPATGAAALVGVGLIVQWALRRRAEQYDLSRLWDTPPPEPEEPFEDTVPDAAAPYCGWCDEAFPEGTQRCSHCGRALA